VLRLAWRNLWRNPRRTLVTLSALVLGTGAIVGLHSYSETAYGELNRILTTQFVGHLQVHGRGWQADPELGNTVRNPVAVETTLADRLPGATSTRRVLGSGLAGTRASSAGVAVLGLEPDRDPLLSVVRGAALDGTSPRQIAVGTGVAEMLEVEPGAELVLVGQAADGSVANDRYTVRAVVDAGSGEMNGSAVFLRIADAQEFFGLGDGVHQIVVRLPTREEDVSGPVAALRSALDVATLEALGWSEIMPEFKGMIDEKRKGSQWIDIVVFVIAALGVFNAMTMATFERTREFGVMASVGTRRSRILGLVVTEALLQGAIGFALGAGIATALVLGAGSIHIGGLTQGMDVMGIRLPTVLELHLQPSALRNAAVVSLLTVLAGGLLPALRASRLQPAEATRSV